MPIALSQAGGYALGAQAEGGAAIRRVALDAGFGRMAQTPFNAVFQACR